MKRRLKEMEEEAAALREMQAKVAKEMQGSNRSSSINGSSVPTQDLDLCISSGTPTSSQASYLSSPNGDVTGADKKIGSIVGDLEVIEALASKLKIEDDDVADSDEEDGPHADDLAFFDM
ncbi:hypothetical protein C2845_PM17G05940 [Panicum miliaceum]|uniref:Uncharacterized protein n=1 Tax=Panicum miliaceum TaxID=4540 RepID=A0A3L6Q2I2_PANMI|nr:hypothetical protein C2845_PM17G05940 [Panicum miliaceum]